MVDLMLSCPAVYCNVNPVPGRSRPRSKMCAVDREARRRVGPDLYHGPAFPKPTPSGTPSSKGSSWVLSGCGEHDGRTPTTATNAVDYCSFIAPIGFARVPVCVHATFQAALDQDQ